MEAANISDREYIQLLTSMEELKKQVTDGFDKLNTRVTRIETIIAIVGSLITIGVVIAGVVAAFMAIK